VKFRRRLVESKMRLVTEELLATCTCNPAMLAVVALVTTVETVVASVVVQMIVLV